MVEKKIVYIQEKELSIDLRKPEFLATVQGERRGTI